MFAGPVHGIFGATPVETMHAFRKGMLEYVTYLVLKNVPPSKKAAFDNLAIVFHKSCRQTYLISQEPMAQETTMTQEPIYFADIVEERAFFK